MRGAGATARLGRGDDQQEEGDPRQGAGARGAQGLSARAHLLGKRFAVALIDAEGGVQVGAPSPTRLRAWPRRGVSWSELRGARWGARGDGCDHQYQPHHSTKPQQEYLRHFGLNIEVGLNLKQLVSEVHMPIYSHVDHTSN